MKLNKEQLLCISKGNKKEIASVGYLFTHNDMSVITCYNTSVVIYVFDNTTTVVDIRPYNKETFPFLIGEGGTSLVRVKDKTGVSDILLIEMSLNMNFSNITTTSYKTTLSNGNYNHKKKTKVSHLNGSGFTFDQFLSQAMAFVLIVTGTGSEDSVNKAHNILSKSMDKWEKNHEMEVVEENRLFELNKKRLEAEKEASRILKLKLAEEKVHKQAIIECSKYGNKFQRHRVRLLSGKTKRYTFCFTDPEIYEDECEELIDKKYLQHNKSKKYSKNLKVCIRNNNGIHRNSRKKETVQLSKDRATQRKKYDMKKLNKLKRNWRCAPVSAHSYQLGYVY